MFDIKNFFTQGIKNTVLKRNNGGFSHNGPWQLVNKEQTLIDRIHIGEISTAEYTISVDLNNDNKEILKVLVTGTLNRASLVVYSRCATNDKLVDVAAVVNDSYVDIYLTPTSDSAIGSKFIYTADYFYNQNPLV